MHCVKILRNVILPGGVAFAATPFVSNKDDEKEKGPVKPSELPIYSSPVESKPAQTEDSYGPLEEMVGSMRKEVSAYIDTVEMHKRKAWQALQEQADNSEELLKYLKEEENVLPRSGAIAVAGLAGYILGLRGGRFRRLALTTIGAGSMAALCYPREAEEYMDTTLLLTKQYVLIAYHFLAQTMQRISHVQAAAKSVRECSLLLCERRSEIRCIAANTNFQETKTTRK